MAEQLIRNEQVAGSIPVTSSKFHLCLIGKGDFYLKSGNNKAR